MTKFAVVPAGWFLMGSQTGFPDETPSHRVWINRFELAIFPVTRADYYDFMRKTGHAAPRDWDNPLFSNPLLPVVGVSWNDAVVYCIWRSSESHHRFRLPSEAEWEHAARGKRSGETYPWGNALPTWLPNDGKGPLKSPWPVTLGPPNDFGIKGIGANIHEWCADWHSKTYFSGSPTHNPAGPATGIRRSSRGGSWRHAFTISRVSARSKLSPTFRYTDYGFRVARDV